jgi:glycine cleavage system H lipoate-binding protein
MKTLTAHKKLASVRVFVGEDNQCVWMKAGVVNYKLCENAYDCENCPFDKAMSRTEKVTSWRQTMRELPYNQRECRHMLTGRVQYRFCSNNYRCNVCEFDQELDEADLLDAPGTVHPRAVAGFQMADSYYYHRGHSWGRIEHGGFVRLGIDDFALRLLGPPTDITLPKIGSHLEQTEVGWTLHRDDKIAGVLAPTDGVVLATNQKALQQLEKARKDPYGEGWLVVVEPRNLKKNLKNLLFEQEAAAWLTAEAQRLEALVMNVYGLPLAATGGEIVDDIYGNLTQFKWDDLVHDFLLT